MPEIQANSNDRPLCPQGPGRFRLKEVEQKLMPTFDDKNVMEPRLIWKFIDLGDRCAPDGSRYEVAVFTGLNYGNDRAKLTWLLDMLHPGISVKWIKENGLNTDRYIGKDYETNIKHYTADSGKVTATFTYLRPLGEPAVAAPAPTATAPPDPFVAENPGALVACEVCGQELSDMQAIGCAKLWGDEHRLCRQHAIEQRERDAESLFAAA